MLAHVLPSLHYYHLQSSQLSAKFTHIYFTHTHSTHKIPSANMYSSILVTLTAAATALAECYTSGETFNSQDQEALSLLNTACSSQLQGTFTSAQTKTVCISLSGNKYIDVQLSYIGTDSARYIGSSECVDGMSKEVNGCATGGATSYTNWKYVYVDLFLHLLVSTIALCSFWLTLGFSVDVNAGQCF